MKKLKSDFMKVYVETYGCAANRNDSEIMKGILRERGYEIVDSEDADAIIINTCIVKHTTEEKIKYRINELKKKYPKKKIVLAGCMVTGEPEIAKSFSLPMVGPRSLSKIADVVSGRINEAVGGWTEKPLMNYAGQWPIKIIQISEGCLGQCTYCITRFARGVQKSYAPESIFKAFKKAVDDGYKEIWITSQDNSSYGLDIGTNFAELMKKLLTVDGDYKVRIGMMNPMFITDDIIDVFKDEHVFKFAHVPVQSGSDRILSLMKRGYTVDKFEKIAMKFKKVGCTLWTDVIVGFPTETEEGFEQTVRLIERISPDFVNVSRYSNRPGVEAKKMKQIPTDVKKERSRIMSKVVNRIAYEMNKKWVGWRGRVLIDEFSHGNFIGRNYAYKPITVDGGELGTYKDVVVKRAFETHLES